MGEIIRPDFSRPKKTETNGVNREEFKSKITQLKPKIIPENKDSAWAAYGLALGDDNSTLLPEYLKLSLSGKIQKLLNLAASPSSLKQARLIVKDYTTEELLGWMQKSTENDWQKRAGFFQAIWAELKGRMKV